MTTHQNILEQLTLTLRADPRILAAWLEGSLGRGNADRYSDIDLHVLLAEGDLAAFQTGAEEWLGAVSPLVLCTLMFGGRMVNALTEEGVRIDLWLHTGEFASVRPDKARVLHDPDGLVRFDQAPAALDEQAIAAELEAQIKEFWRCIALLPTVAGRKEKIVGFQGLGVEVGLLTNILLKGYRVERDTGVKKLNAFLPGETRAAMERALSLDGLTEVTLIHAHLALADIVRDHGRFIAEQHGFAYPVALEGAVLRYVEAELAVMQEHEGVR